MSLGTNATLEERLEYAPHEITTNDIAEMIDELTAWRELLDHMVYGPEDLKERIEGLEAELDNQDQEIKELEDEKSDLETKVYNLENLVEELEDRLAEMESNPAP